MAVSIEALAFSPKFTLHFHSFNFLFPSSPPNLNTFKTTSFLPIPHKYNQPSLTLFHHPHNKPNPFKIEAYSLSNSPNSSTLLFPNGFKPWRVTVHVPPSGFSSKAHALDFYVDVLTNVLGNDKDAQMCFYKVFWQQPNFGFCCMLDDESSQQLAAVAGVLSVQPDEQFGSENNDYNGGTRSFSNAPISAETTELSKTKLFITGLSFYTSEKTLRSAFEAFGELVEVKVIMDKISKRSKGYAFVEYSTEEAATVALQEMNGKIINGWMIVVDRAKSPPKFNRGRRKSMPLQDGKLT